MRSGGQILVDQLQIHGTDTVFGIPGESVLPFLDAIHGKTNAMRFVICRQEGGAAMMADGFAKLTGKPGICMVARASGATNASAGLHVAYQDSTPLIMLVGQVSRKMLEREAFQEVDYRHMFGPLTKWVAQIDDPARIPEFVSRAFSVAMSGRRGPVVLAVPEDVMSEMVDCPDGRPVTPAESYPAPAQMKVLKEMLTAAKRPAMIVGGSGWSESVARKMQSWAEASFMPVVASFRRQDYVDNESPVYCGELGIGANPKLQKRVQDADALLLVGARLNDIATRHYELFDIPVPSQKLIQVHAGAEELNRVYSADLAINASSAAFAEALEEMGPLHDDAARTSHSAEARADYEKWQEPTTSPGKVQMSSIVKWLGRNLPADAVFTNGAGNYASWVHRFHRYRKHTSQLAPVSGSMGYGVPAAIAAKLKQPERMVVAFAGDGCFLMTGQEFATAVQYGANIVVIVVNNSMYGSIRGLQERLYPERVEGTSLVNPDFAAMARAYGGHGETVERTEDFAAAFKRARGSGKPSLIEIKLDPEALTTSLTLQQIRAAGLANKAKQN